MAERVAQCRVGLAVHQRHAFVGGVEARIIRIVVDFPAPLGPTKPVTWPGPTVNDSPSTASVEPNRLRSPVTSMVASMQTDGTKADHCCRHAGERSFE